MDIGSKIKNARTECRMTQEQVAEALGVTRQTMSNWENGKSFPDIASVVKMSDLYHVSLDDLLKEDQMAMSDYVGYLKESSDVVKSKEKSAKLTVIVAYLLIWIGTVILYWGAFSWDPTDVMGFEAAFEYMILPIVVLVIAYQIGRNNFWGKGKWFLIPLFGVSLMVLQGLTVGIDICVARKEFDGIYFFNPVLFAFGAIAALLGMACGYVKYLGSRRKEEISENAGASVKAGDGKKGSAPEKADADKTTE